MTAFIIINDFGAVIVASGVVSSTNTAFMEVREDDVGDKQSKSSQCEEDKQRKWRAV